MLALPDTALSEYTDTYTPDMNGNPQPVVPTGISASQKSFLPNVFQTKFNRVLWPLPNPSRAEQPELPSVTPTPEVATVVVPPAQEKKNNKKRAAPDATNANGTRRKLPDLPQRSSSYRGVTRHRWTGRYEAHLWDSSCQRENKTGKGRTKGKQVYLGGYESELVAARAYDRVRASTCCTVSADSRYILSDTWRHEKLS